MLTAIGIGTNVDSTFLSAISNNNYYRIGQKDISYFFQTLSASMSMNSGGNPQHDLLDGLAEEMKGQI